MLVPEMQKKTKKTTYYIKTRICSDTVLIWLYYNGTQQLNKKLAVKKKQKQTRFFRFMKFHTAATEINGAKLTPRR